MDIQFTNFAATTLASGVASGAGSLTVSAGTGTKFPTLAGSQYFYAVLTDAATGTIREIVKVTARATDTFTIVKAQEGTSDLSWIAGDKVELHLTAATMNTFAALGTSTVQALNAQLVGGLSTSQLATLQTSSVQALNVSLLGGLSTSQIAVLQTSTVQALNAQMVGSLTTSQLAVLAVTETFTAPQRGTITDNASSLSFNLNTTNFWKCTPTAGGALTFTNIPSGQGGSIQFINGSNYAITAAANTKVTSTFLTTISATGNYIIHYYCDGTNVMCSTAGAYA